MPKLPRVKPTKVIKALKRAGFYVGRGDSVKEFKRMWKGMKIEKIHREILEAKKKKEI